MKLVLVMAVGVVTALILGCAGSRLPAPRGDFPPVILPPDVETRPEPDPEPEPADPDAETIEELLAKMMAKKLAEEQAANAPTKDLAAALDRLDISETEKQAIRQHILDTKKAILEMCEVPTEDGRVFAEELIDAFIRIQNGEGTEADIGPLFLELSTTKIPGDIEGRTYIQAIEALKVRNKEDIGRILSTADQKKLTNAHADWSDFDIGDGDPWEALYLERLQKYQAEKD